MRPLATACLAALALVISLNADARPYDLNDPADRIRLDIALGCKPSQDVTDPGVYFWTGKIFGRRMGEPDRHLFDIQGINPRACQIFDDPDRGPGYFSSARELMIYLDPETGELLDTWTNPWTGETVDVIHMVNDPASMRAPVYAYDEQGEPVTTRNWEDWGDHVIARGFVPRFGPNPMGGAYEDFIGGQYQVLSLTATRVHKSDLADMVAGQRVPYTSTWVRISPWIPWMGMGGREGTIIVATEGRSFESVSDIPEPINTLVKTRWPLMQRVPDFDDDRAFVNSWTAIKQAIDRKRAEEGQD